jgi:hypothetical protein
MWGKQTCDHKTPLNMFTWSSRHAANLHAKVTIFINRNLKGNIQTVVWMQKCITDKQNDAFARFEQW